MARAFETYLQITEDRYTKLARDFAKDLAKRSPSLPISPALRRARENYFKTALGRGYDFFNIDLVTLAQMDVTSLKKSSDLLPDKTKNETQKAFLEAAKERKYYASWPEIFPQSTDTIYLSMAVSEGKSVDEYLQEYIDSHNEQIPQQIAKARNEADSLEEEQEKERTLQKIGKHISQRLIRINPDKKTLLQTYNEKKEQWEDGPKIGKFLEQNLEWHLLHLYQQEGSRKQGALFSTTNTIQSEFARLKDFIVRGEARWHTGKLSSDIYDPDSLVIMVSKDPVLIGEMSSGQHWDSCMAEEGSNFSYTFDDIKAGTLVAYVVSKEDPDARYPLMRQLLKPYENEYGEFILVPGKPYGANASGNSKTRDTLDASLHEFLRTTVNAGKTGKFTIEPTLYADGAATHVTLGKEWDQDSIQEAILDFHNKTLQEWLTERQRREDILVNKRGYLYTPDDQKRAEKERERYNNLISTFKEPRLLAKRFYIETNKQSIGESPSPAFCLAAAQNPAIRSKTQMYYEAAVESNFTQFSAYLDTLESYERTKKINGLHSMIPESGKHNYAVWLYERKSAPDLRHYYLKHAAQRITPETETATNILEEAITLYKTKAGWHDREPISTLASIASRMGLVSPESKEADELLNVLEDIYKHDIALNRTDNGNIIRAVNHIITCRGEKPPPYSEDEKKYALLNLYSKKGDIEKNGRDPIEFKDFIEEVIESTKPLATPEVRVRALREIFDHSTEETLSVIREPLADAFIRLADKMDAPFPKGHTYLHVAKMIAPDSKHTETLKEKIQETINAVMPIKARASLLQFAEQFAEVSGPLKETIINLEVDLLQTGKLNREDSKDIAATILGTKKFEPSLGDTLSVHFYNYAKDGNRTPIDTLSSACAAAIFVDPIKKEAPLYQNTFLETAKAVKNIPERIGYLIELKEVIQDIENLASYKYTDRPIAQIIDLCIKNKGKIPDNIQLSQHPARNPSMPTRQKTPLVPA